MTNIRVTFEGKTHSEIIDQIFTYLSSIKGFMEQSIPLEKPEAPVEETEEETTNE